MELKFDNMYSKLDHMESSVMVKLSAIKELLTVLVTVCCLVLFSLFV